MRHGVGSTHGVEFVGGWIVIAAGCLAGLARVIGFGVMAVDVTIVLVLENATRVGLGVTAGVLHCIERRGGQ